MFSSPMALLALLALPAIIGIHLFRRQAERRRVSAVFLWGVSGSSPGPGRKRSPLAMSIPLLLELGTAACIALAMAHPRACSEGDAPHLVVVLDASISMNAIEGAPAEQAVQEARRRIGELPTGAKVSLVASGSPPVILAGPGAEPVEAELALESFQPSRRGHSLQPAVDLALGLSGGAHVLALTDGPAPDALHPSVSWLSYGEAAPNAAITGARRSQGGMNVRLSAFGGARSGVLRLEEVGEALATESWSLEEGEELGLGFSLAPGTGAVTVLLETEGPDGLAEDDRAVLLPPEPRPLKLAAAVSGETAAALGLAGGGSRIGAWLRIVPNSTESTPGEADLLLTETEETGGRDAWLLRLLPVQGDGAVTATGPFWSDIGHPLLDGARPATPAWRYSKDRRLRGRQLIRHRGVALLTEEVFAAGRRIYRIQLDPRGSTLARTPAWPVMLSNLAELRRQALPGPEEVNLRLGEDFSYSGAEEGVASLHGAEERLIRHPGGDLVAETPALGLHELRIGELRQPFAVNMLDPEESDLGGRSRGTGEAEAAAAALASSPRSLSSVLCMGALLLLGLHWKATEER